jgi:acetoin utilization deacetylase AcuC-like enzyme
MGSFHPESPDRLSAIQDQLISSGLVNYVDHYDAIPVTREQLLRVHAPEYLDSLDDAVPDSGIRYLDPDTALNPHSLDAARNAAGAAVLGVDLVVAGKARTAFCAVRPPGHHAESARAMGFCLYNNVAVGIRHALAAHGLRRALVVDFDVHHGNGTEEIFTGDDTVLMTSTFQHPLYPYSGFDSVAANMVNVPLAAGAGGEKFREAVENRWIPAIERFQPEIVFVSAGFDAHREDPLAGLRLVEDDFAWVTRRLVEVADRYAGGRIVSVLEGGYALSALARSVVAHMRELARL